MAASGDFQSMPTADEIKENATSMLVRYKVGLVPDPDDPIHPAGEVDAILCPPQEWLNPNLPLMMPVCVANAPEPERRHLLHATARLGLPLYYQVLPDRPTGEVVSIKTVLIDRSKAKGTMIDSTHNRVLRNLAIRTSSTSPDVHFLEIDGHPKPNVLFTRADGKALSELHVRALWSLVEVEIIAPGFVGGNLHDQLCPESFIKAWNRVDTEEECPVTLACKGCGKDEGKLMKCGKCGVVRYCNAECQKGDWSFHKKVCVKG